MNKSLHIVCHDAPAPPDYGGVIDLYYKIVAFAAIGIKINLHYFDYKTERTAQELAPYCDKIFAYKRKPFLQTPTFSKPHIVASRISFKLIERLNADNNPILIEYIHCTGILPYIKNTHRRIVVRLHNDEALYYRELSKTEPNILKKTYYKAESSLLNNYQKTLPATLPYATVSQNDAQRFKEIYGLRHAFFLPVFLPWQQVTSLAGSGDYCLYHGNLGVAENEAAARWLIQNIFSKIKMPLVIAGKTISTNLIKAAKGFSNIRFKSDPTEEELTNLIQHAHIHVLPNFNKTGVKLKLLHVLFQGRFCITHSSELADSRTVAVAQTVEDYMRFLKSFCNEAFTAEDITERTKILQLYNNKVNAERLIARLY